MAGRNRRVGRYPIQGKRGRGLGNAVARKTAIQSRSRGKAETVRIPEFASDRMLAREQGRGTKSLRLLQERRKMEGTPVTGRPSLTPVAQKMRRARRRR